jgi:hypothetical protein
MLLLVFAEADHSWIVRGLLRLPTIVASRYSGDAVVLPELFSARRTGWTDGAQETREGSARAPSPVVQQTLESQGFTAVAQII